MGTLTKRKLVLRISYETGLIQQQVFDVIQKTLDYIIDSLAEGETVELRNFGILAVRLTKPRIGRNPNEPGSVFPIPAQATVKFKAGKVMKERVAQLSAAMKRQTKAAQQPGLKKLKTVKQPKLTTKAVKAVKAVKA